MLDWRKSQARSPDRGDEVVNNTELEEIEEVDRRDSEELDTAYLREVAMDESSSTVADTDQQQILTAYRDIWLRNLNAQIEKK